MTDMSVRAVVAAADREEEDWTGIAVGRDELRELGVLCETDSEVRGPEPPWALRQRACSDVRCVAGRSSLRPCVIRLVSPPSQSHSFLALASPISSLVHPILLQGFLGKLLSAVEVSNG